MNSFTLFCLFYLLKFCSNIQIDIDCNQGQYYDSINHECADCHNDGLLYNKICYSNNSSKGVYGITNSNLAFRCGDDEVLTELDDEGKHLGYFMCAKTTIKYNGSVSYIIEIDNKFDFYTLKNIRRPEIGNDQQSFTLRDFKPEEINYSIDACFNGTYEKSCQYLINLCTLSLYGHAKFCSLIEDLEKKKNM